MAHHPIMWTMLKIMLFSLCFQNEASAPASALRARAIPWSSEIFSVIAWSTHPISSNLVDSEDFHVWKSCTCSWHLTGLKLHHTTRYTQIHVKTGSYTFSAFKRLANGSELTKDALRLKTKWIDLDNDIWQMFDIFFPKTALLQCWSKAQPKRYLTEGGIEDCKGVPHLAARNYFLVMANHWIWLDFTLPPFHPSKGKAWKYALALLQKVGIRPIHIQFYHPCHKNITYLTYVWDIWHDIFFHETCWSVCSVFFSFFFNKPASQFFVELCLQLSPLFRWQLSQAATRLPLMRPQLRCFSRFSLDPKRLMMQQWFWYERMQCIITRI